MKYMNVSYKNEMYNISCNNEIYKHQLEEGNVRTKDKMYMFVSRKNEM